MIVKAEDTERPLWETHEELDHASLVMTGDGPVLIVNNSAIRLTNVAISELSDALTEYLP